MLEKFNRLFAPMFATPTSDDEITIHQYLDNLRIGIRVTAILSVCAKHNIDFSKVDLINEEIENGRCNHILISAKPSEVTQMILDVVDRLKLDRK